VITELLLGLGEAIVRLIGVLLPEGDVPQLPGLGGVASLIAKADSLVPVASVVQAALVLLSFGVAFVLVRLVLVVWNLLWP
jgi:hypothetical protein